MADDADLAQGVTEHYLNLALSKIKVPNRTIPSAEFCCICDQPIPKKRQQILPGIQTCVFHAGWADS